MRLFTLLIFMSLLFATSIYSQTTIEPNSITLGIDQINMVDGDTILHWGKNRSAFRGGFFRSADITNANTGQYSFAYGEENRAVDILSFALGSFNNVKGTGSFAFGKGNLIESAGGFALGNGNVLNASQSFTIGQELITNSIFTIALGRYNVNVPDPPNEEDKPLFILGNGNGRDIPRSNAITVLADGRMSLRTTTPESDLHLMHRDSFMSAGFRIQNENGGNWWRFYTRSQYDALALYNNNFEEGTQSIGNFNDAGVYSNNSDRRLKKDIIDLPYGLVDVLRLAPKRYQFKHVKDRLDIGLIAQDVLEIIPELVYYDEREDKYMMNYDGFGVISIKAIQELNDVVEKQSETIESQQSIIEELIRRVELLESSK